MAMSPRIPIYSYLKIWPWKSKVEVMVEVTVGSHNMAPTFDRLTSLSFVSIDNLILEIRLFQNLTLKIQGQGHGGGQSWKSQSGCNILSTHPFRSMSIDSWIPEIQNFLIESIKTTAMEDVSTRVLKKKQRIFKKVKPKNDLMYQVSEWVIKFNGLSRTADSEVHIVHISRVIIACTLKSLSSPT